MAYVTVPKDLTHVKSKVLFGLTKRRWSASAVPQDRFVLTIFPTVRRPC